MRRPFDSLRLLRRFVVPRRVIFARRVVGPLALAALVAGPALGVARATPAITMDIASGDVLFQENATQPWFPASTTKLMTVYVALSAVRDHQIAMDTPLVVSARASRMPPSKMGFPVGTQITLDNALKILMVRSANDVAITVAEGISGSVEAFADDMNQAAAQLGMRESHFVNPNGLPDANHVSSARDMAILARALYAQFPQEAGLFNLGELALGSERIGNHNNLLGRYPGVDGMKTGFTCSAGFNVVASAYRDGRRLVVVVLGAPSVATRTQKVAALLDRGFAGVDRPIASVVALPSTAGSAPDMRNQVCRNRSGLVASFESEVTQLDAPLMGPAPSAPLGLGTVNPERAFLFNTNNVASGGGPTALRIKSMPTPVFDPVPIHIGAEPGYTGVVAEPRAPHTPIGTQTQPVTVEAYAAAPAAHGAAGVLGVDPSALPLKGRRARLARQRKGHATMKASAEAPKTKVLAGKEGEEPSASEPTKTIGEKPGKSVKSAAKPSAKIAAVKRPAAGEAVKPKTSPKVSKDKDAAKAVAVKPASAKPTGTKSSSKKTPAKVAAVNPNTKAKAKSADGE